MKTLTDEEYEYLVYQRAALSKVWTILADGERDMNPDADPDYDTNNMYDLVREGAEARKKLADGKREIEKLIASRTEEALVEFDRVIDTVVIAVNAERKLCARVALDEKVSGETGTAEDAAYNQACDDIAAAIQGHQ